MIFETKPYEHQITAYNKCMYWLKQDKDYFAFFMDMGTGKTKVTIDVCSNLFAEGKINAVLLIAPNGIQEQWYTQEILKHTPVITTELLWRNSSAQYWKDKLYDFVGPKAESIEIKLKEAELAEKEQIKESKKFDDDLAEQERKELEMLNDLFGDSSGGDGVSVIYSRPMEPETPRKTKWESQTECLKWMCVNVDRFSSGSQATFQPFIDFLKNHNCAIVIDEGTIIKNPSANRTTIIKKLARLSKVRFLLTGTPVTNSPFDVWSMMDFLKENFWGCNHFVFKNRYGIFIKDYNEARGQTFTRSLRPHEFDMVRNYLRAGKTPEDISCMMGISESNVNWIKMHPEATRPFKRLEEIKQAILPCSFTIKKEECLDIPDKIFDTVLLEMSSEQARIYKDLKRKLIAMYEDQELTVQNKATLIMRLQQIAGGHFPFKGDEGEADIKRIKGTNPKIKFLKQDIAEAGEQKIIIWARFVPEIELILEELKREFPFKRIEGYYGAVKQGDRNELKNEFQEGKIDILVINPQTGSMGLNLQVSTLHYFYSNSYSLTFRLQAEDRSHRIGQTKNVQYKDLVAKGTADEAVLISLRNNKEVLEFFRNKSLKELI